jgi:hypothetical protein
MGTGDCFVVKFYTDNAEKFTMLIDCGSCRGGPDEFSKYIKDLKEYVNNKIDLLVVTHEHQDHVNGFAKCKSIFEKMDFGKAWFAWTEEPGDPDKLQEDLIFRKRMMRKAYTNGMKKFTENMKSIADNFEGDYNQNAVEASNNAFLHGLETLADINLPEPNDLLDKESLAGMKAIKDILKNKQVQIEYLKPGTVKSIEEAPGLKFYILGPPIERSSVFKEGKQGIDVYKKYFAQNKSMLLAKSFVNPEKLSDSSELPFNSQYVDDRSGNTGSALYDDDDNKWRRIDYDWIMGVGTLALRLDDFLNNTSLVIAIELEESGKVMLFPGDAEFGNWESWHLIEQWKNKGKKGEHLVQDLLNRTAFLKIAHHLSYNGTALKKGIEMMPLSDMVSMASLDRTRISKNWKNTMPNKFLLRDFIKRCNGRVILMNESEINDPPSASLQFDHLKEFEFDKNGLYKQYTMKV